MKNFGETIGLYEKAMPKMAWDSRFKVMSKLGYDCFELSVDNLRMDRLDWKPAEILELRERADEYDIRLFSMNLSAHRHFPLGSTNVATSAGAVDILKKAVDFCYVSGIRVIQLAGYDVYTEETSTTKTKELFIHNLAHCVEYAEQVGVMLAIEPVDLDFITKCEDAMEYVNMISSPWLKIYPDMANIAAAGHDVISDLQCAEGHMVAIHVKDGRERVVRGVPFGQGIVEFEKVFEKLNTMNFKGPYIVEMWGEDDPVYEESVKFALEFTKKHIAVASSKALSP